MINGELRCGVVGIGMMGKNHARIYNQIEGAQLVAIADTDERQGKTIADQYRCEFYADYRDMLANEMLQGVSVCTPTSLHYEISKEIIHNRIGLLVEKPICDNIEQARSLILDAKKNNVTLMVGHIERYNPAVMKLKEMILQGIFGELIAIQANRLGLSPPRIKDANVVIDFAIHDIDICNYLFDDLPDKVCFNCGRAILSDRIDHVEAMLNYGNKVAIINSNWITPVKIRTLSVTGTNGFAELDYINQNLKLYRLDLQNSFVDFIDFIDKFGNTKKQELEIKRNEPLMIEVNSFINELKSDKVGRVDDFAVHALEIALKYQTNEYP